MSRALPGMVLAAGLCSVIHAQSAGKAKTNTKLEFEVASVKRSDPSVPGVIKVDPGGPGSADAGRVTYRLSTIRDLMADAYNVKRYQISGGPNWLESERFDIAAKVPAGATKEQVRLMLQNLLAERFGLTLHRETKELPMYALLVGPKGARLKESTADGSAPDAQALPLPPGGGKEGVKIGSDGCPEVPQAAGRGVGSFMMMTPGGACMISHGQTMEFLATQLSNRFDRPVVDETGLKGNYDWRLRFDPSSMPEGRTGGAVQMKGPGPAGTEASRGALDGESAPSFSTALQEQLGLRMESKKGPIELLVIDHVEKTPSAN